MLLNRTGEELYSWVICNMYCVRVHQFADMLDHCNSNFRVSRETREEVKDARDESVKMIEMERFSDVVC